MIYFLYFLLPLCFSWQKHNYSFFENLTDQEFTQHYLGLQLFDLNLPSFEFYPNMYEKNVLPDSFDAREKWPQCIRKMRNQLYCGSCWAISATSVLSDRFCITTNGTINEELSPQYLLSCDNNNRGCFGGTLFETWDFLENHGTPPDQCVPYLSFLGKPFACMLFQKCIDHSPIRLYFAEQFSTYSFSSISGIKRDIILNGPLQAGLLVYSDFKTYKSGVYHPETGKIEGAHAIKLIGWNKEMKEGRWDEYWIGLNSWGEEWGEGGLVRIGMGECLIEYNCLGGKADLARSTL